MNPGCAQGSSAHRLPVSTESFNCWRIKVCRILLSVSFVCVRVSRRVTCWEELFRNARGSYFTSLCVMCVRCSELLWHSLVSLLHQGCSMFTSVKAFEGQQYSTLKRQCLQSGLLFEDPRFPAIDDSLFYQGNRIGRVVWKRPRVSWFVQSFSWWKLIFIVIINQNLQKTCSLAASYQRWIKMLVVPTLAKHFICEKRQLSKNKYGLYLISYLCWDTSCF